MVEFTEQEELIRFGVTDYVVFIAALALCVGIAIYYSFFVDKMSTETYLLGGRTMKTFPIVMSLLATLISPIGLLGGPTDIYFYGSQYLFCALPSMIVPILMYFIYIPTIYELHLISVYEYFEMRFSRAVRILGAVLFIISSNVWITVVTYLTALSFNQATGVHLYIISTTICLVCVMYTYKGGIKGVVWADVLQTFTIYGSLLVLVIKGTSDIGGIGEVWRRNMEGGRLEFPSDSLDFSERHSLLVLILGGTPIFLSFNLQQSHMQRYFSLPNLRSAKISTWWLQVGYVCFIFLSCYCGFLAYAQFIDCDPFTSKAIKSKDQILTFYVMKALSNIPGLVGLFIAGICSASLSSMSTAFNSVAAVVYKDLFVFYRNGDRHANCILKCSVVVMGLFVLALVFIVDKLGSMLQVAFALQSIQNGTMVGIFTIALLFPWANSKGILTGALVGTSVTAWIVIGNRIATLSGDVTIPLKELRTDGCPYNYTSFSSPTAEPNYVFPVYRISYMWYSLIGALVTALVAIIVSFLTGPTDLRALDKKLVSHVIRKYLPASKISNSNDAEKNGVYQELLLRADEKN